MEKAWNRVLLWARSFVRSHSDLAMSHVAAYYKPYPRASRDVARLIEEAGGTFRRHYCVASLDKILGSGRELFLLKCACGVMVTVEPVLHDDITTHMCSCVGGAISGVIGKCHSGYGV